MQLTVEEQAALAGDAPPALAMAMRIVVETARLLGASDLQPITSAHVDGCIYHGDAGLGFVERLCELGARTAVPTTLNVGAIDLKHPELVRGPARHRDMARRMMQAYVRLGCKPTWTCAPYQAGHRPALGEHVAWAESNAVVFANSVLGARTNRNGDFLDICAAITARVPRYGLHLEANRHATVRIDLADIPAATKSLDAFYPVLGAWLGETVGDAVAVLDGLPADVGEDRLKALGAGAAATGAVGLFHVVGVTPEAATLSEACGGVAPATTIRVSAADIRAVRDRLSTAAGEQLDCVALGSPHFSLDECRALHALLPRGQSAVPIYVCTRRDVLDALERDGALAEMQSRGVVFVADTCVVVTPILERKAGVMMTSSAKFAHYGPANTGYQTVFGTLEDCVASAVAGRVIRDERRWQ
ncbi:MAG: aconitase X catalytic domain-containing protein [Gammaproteobacteria bacterium]|nr:aconitase X catalytic domain-containing protein [Gammaproteobacteria bacterium]